MLTETGGRVTSATEPAVLIDLDGHEQEYTRDLACEDRSNRNQVRSSCTGGHRARTGASSVHRFWHP